VYRLFDLSRSRPQKRAARAARSARERAFVDALAEIKALLAVVEDARWVRARLAEEGAADAAAALSSGMAPAEATITRFQHSTKEFREEEERKHKAARGAADHEALAELERGRRDALIGIGEEAKSRVDPLRALVREGRAALERVQHERRITPRS
jgi:hypothetical protein